MWLEGSWGVPGGRAPPPLRPPCPIVRTECLRTIATCKGVGRVVGFDHVIDHGVDRADDRAVGTECVFGSDKVGGRDVFRVRVGGIGR